MPSPVVSSEFASFVSLETVGYIFSLSSWSMMSEPRFFLLAVVLSESPPTELKYELSSLLYVPFFIEALSENRLYRLVELLEPNIEFVEFQKFIASSLLY